jgi:hypothetical protein
MAFPYAQVSVVSQIPLTDRVLVPTLTQNAGAGTSLPRHRNHHQCRQTQIIVVPAAQSSTGEQMAQ